MYRILLLFPFLLLSAAQADDYDALAPFEFLAGHCWRGEFADTKAVDTHCYTWVYGGRHLRDVHVVTGNGPDYRGESIYSIDGATGDVVFRYWNSLGGVSDGRVEFAEGAIVAPGEEYVGDDGRLRRFRSSLRPVDRNSYEARTEELIQDEWQNASRVTFRRHEAATDTGQAARQQAEKLAAFAPFIGEWTPAPDDPSLEHRPDMRGRVAHAIEWGPRRMQLDVLENYSPGNAQMAVSRGIVYWDHVDQGFNFVASSAYGWTFEGAYRLLDDGVLERIYAVHYQDGDEYTPVPELGGQSRRFRETYTLVNPDRLEATLEIDKDGAWASFGAGEYAMVRRRP